MKMLLVGAVGILALQVLLVGAYLAVNAQDPLVLNPDRGGMVENGVMMAAFCGPQSGKRMLDKISTGGRFDSWTRGRTVRGKCTIWYHHREGYNPCSGHNQFVFNRHPCLGPHPLRED